MDNPVVVSRRTPGGALSIARRCAAHPKKSIAVLLWMLGLWIAFLAKPGKLTKDQLQAFHTKVAEVSFRRPSTPRARRRTAHNLHPPCLSR